MRVIARVRLRWKHVSYRYHDRGMRPGKTGGAPWSSGSRTGRAVVTVARARLTARTEASPAKMPVRRRIGPVWRLGFMTCSFPGIPVSAETDRSGRWVRPDGPPLVPAAGDPDGAEHGGTYPAAVGPRADACPRGQGA